MTKKRAQLHRVGAKPKHEKLPWPGLKAKDHLSRVVTRAVRETKERRENEAWAETQIAQVLDYVPPEAAIKMVFRETRRRRKPMPLFAKAALCRTFGSRREQRELLQPSALD
jgi:hypothetical protein